MIGRTLSRYRIDAALGEGGMGVVYRARDLRLQRDVAIKLLPARAIEDPQAQERFRREALALSRLNHPNIAVIHDFDSDGDTQFLVMELLEGETLDRRLRRGPLSEAETRDVARQVARALEAAHRQGLIHRDIKPGNIAVSREGHVKVLDFGLARILPAHGTQEHVLTLTAPEATLGTPAYMAPEQLRSGEVDARADLYALGAVMFECLTGHRPFETGGAYAVAGDALHTPAPSVRSLRPEVTPAFADVVGRCLAKDPASRPATATQLLGLLATEAPEIAAEDRTRTLFEVRAGPPVLVRLPSRRTWLAGILGVVGVIASVIAVTYWKRPRSSDMNSLAVLPLENISRDPEQDYFCAGMTDELTTTLAQLSGLNVVSRNSVLALSTGRMATSEIARKLHVRTLLTGTVRRVGSRARISAALVNVSDGRTLWADSFESDLSDVLTIQSRVARAVAEHVRIQLTERERGVLNEDKKVNPVAHEEYLRGRLAWNQYSEDGFRQAIAHYQAALQADPKYAPAYAGLAEAYAGVSSLYIRATEAMPRAREAAQQAIRLDARLGDALATLGYVEAAFDWRWRQADTTFRRALALSPGSANIHVTYGYLLMVQHRFDEATREVHRAVEIDPLSAYPATWLAIVPYHERRYETAERLLRRTLTNSPSFQLAEIFLGQSLLMRGQLDSAKVHLEEAVRLDPGNSVMLGWVGFLEARAGHASAARRVLARIEELQRTSYVQPYAFALVHVALGERDAALQDLERGGRERAEQTLYLGVDPAMDELRSDARFQRILASMGLSSPGGRAPGGQVAP